MAISESINALIAGEQVANSKLNSKLREELLAEDLLLVISHGSRKSYRARDTEALKRFLIDKDECYRILEVDTLDSRASMARETGNSKLTSVRSCPGFPVNSYDAIECMLDGNPFVVNPQEGSFLFVTNWEQFTIPLGMVVVGVENMENFRLIRRQRFFFERYLQSQGLSTCALFVSRYPQSADLRRWLNSIPNRYIHFGDLDLAGVSIFLTEYYIHLGERASMLIPQDYKQRLLKGSRERYDTQWARFAQMEVIDSRVQPLVDAIHTARRGYDQEGFIE